MLDELDEASHRQYLITNGNIAEGKNPHIKFGKNGGFTLATPKQEESDAEPLQHFFPERSYVPLLEVLSTVNGYFTVTENVQRSGAAILPRYLSTDRCLRIRFDIVRAHFSADRVAGQREGIQLAPGPGWELLGLKRRSVRISSESFSSVFLLMLSRLRLPKVAQ